MNLAHQISWNPLRCSGTALPPNLLLVGKLIFLCLLLRGDLFQIPEPFLPLLRGLDQFPRPDLAAYALQLSAIVAGVLLLGNRSVRFSAVALGAVLFVALLANRGSYRNGMFFCVCMLTLIGLYGPPRGTLWVRMQFPIMFVGAALNKLLEADWRSGRYFEYWMHDIIQSPVYAAAASLLPAGSLSIFMCWVTIILQFSFAIGLLSVRSRHATLYVVLLFYVSTVLLAGTTFGIFFSVLVFSLLVFADWPEPGTVICRYDAHRRLPNLLSRISATIDRDGLFRWLPMDAPAGDSEPNALRFDESFTNCARSTIRWLMLNPLTYFVLVVLINIPGWYLRSRSG